MRAPVVAIAVALSPVSMAIASEHPLRDVERYPLAQALLQPGVDLTGQAVVTRDTIQADQLTPPSLWRAEQQYGGKLLEHWIAHTGTDGAPRRVDYVVNRQLWSLYSYLERYQFLHHFGTAAHQYGYSSRIFTSQGELLGLYLCPLPPGPLPEAPLPLADIAPCEVELDAVGMQPSRGPLGF